jgi:hypothetical protein
MAMKDAYFKFDNEWREENRNNNPGILLFWREYWLE